jgi:hypothetical protein
MIMNVLEEHCGSVFTGYLIETVYTDGKDGCPPITLHGLGIGMEVLTVVRIHNAVWFRTPCSLLHDYECFGGALLICLHRLSEDGDGIYRR